MKIRLMNDSIRVRLTQTEVETLASGGAIEAVTPIPGDAFTCVVQPSTGSIEAHHSSGRLTVLLPAQQTATWAASEDEGMYANAGSVRVAIEKDYRCIHKPNSQE